MLFLREFTYGQVAIVLMLHVYFIKVIVSEDCEKAFRQLAVKQERGRPCVYVEKSGLKFIGWKFALNQGQQARAVFTHLGADYGQFFKGPVTLSDARCECNKVPCLNKQQMNKLLILSLEGSLRDTLTIVPSLRNLCCSVKIRILLLVFTSGGRIFKNLASPDIEYHIKMQSWFALSQMLMHTEWCRNYQEFCTEQTRGIVDGCADYREARGKRDKRGINLLKWKENATCTGNTCHGESSTSVLQPSATIGAIQSTAKNKLIPVQPSTSRRSPVGTSSAATPTNAGNSNGDSQLLPRPSHIQMPDVNQMTRGTDFFTATVSSVATKSLGKDAPLQMTSMPSLLGYSRDYFYYDATTVSATSSPNHQSRHEQKTQGTSGEISYGLSSTDWVSLTPSSKFVTEIAKPSAGILSSSLKLWSTTSEAERVFRTSSWSFHRKSSVLKTGMAFSSLELKEYLSTTSKTPTGQKLQFQTSLSQVPGTLKFAESLLPTTSSSKSLSLAVPLETPFVYQTRTLVKFVASPLVHKDWSSSLKYDSENSPILLSNTLQVSKAQLTEERGFFTSPWPLEQRTVQRTSSISKARTISSSLGGNSPLSTASASNTTITASSSFDTLPSQVLLTSYSFGFTHSVSQVLQTKRSLNVAELQTSPTLSMIHDKWASFPTPGKKLVTETTKSASVIGRNTSQFSRTRASLSLEIADGSLTSWPLHQTSVHRPSSLLKKKMASSPLKRTKSLSTSSTASNGHKLLFETSLTQVLGTKTTQKFPKSLFAPTLASKTSLSLALPLETPSNQKTRTVIKPFEASRMVRKYWSSSLKFDSENSPIVLSSTLQVSKTRSIEKREFLTSPWQPEQITVHRTRSVSKARTISSSLGGKSLSSTASASNTTITASSSIETLPSQILLTSYFPGLTHSVSQVLQTKTSLNIAELQSSPTLSMIHDKWASSPTPGKKLVTETTKSASVIRSNASQFSRTWSSLPLEVANVSSPWLLQQSSFYRTDSVLKAGLTSSFSGPKPQLSAISASQTSTAALDLTIETFQSHVLLTSSSLVGLKYSASTTSTSRTSNDSESSFETFLSQVVQSNILDVKITKQLQNTVSRTPQTRHTLSSVFAVRSMERVSSVRRSDATAWSSTLSPSVGPLSPSSPSTTITIVTKTMANTSRSDSLANLRPSVSVTGTPSFAVSSFTSGKKANSTTVNAVSVRTRRPYRSGQATSSLRLTLGLPLQTSQRMASVLDHSSTPTWTERSVARTQSFPEKHTGTRLRSSYDLKSATFILPSSPSVNLPFSTSSSLYITLQSVAPIVPTPSILPSFSSSELAATSSVLGFAKYDQTYLVILSGNCTMLENKDDFSSQFKAVLTRLIYVCAADISVLEISCGSVHVMFSIREAKRRNITSKLRDIVESKLFKFQYNNITFEALELSEISAKPSGTTTRPPRTTHTSRIPEAKQIVLILFILVLSFFAALSVLLAVIFCIRFCRCCQKRERSRKRKKTPAEVELKTFSSLYNNLFRKVDYYGGSRQLPRTPSKDKHEEFELADIENQQVSTATALLSETEKVADEEKKFSFDDDDSCASVLFY